MTNQLRYQHVGLGGTFDHLHKGHKAIIEKAFSVAGKVSIGIAVPKLLVNKELKTTIQSYEERKNELINYIKEKGYFSRSYIFLLKDIYGTAINDKTLECLVVSTDSYANAKLVNQARIKAGLSKLDIITIPLVFGRDNMAIRSTRIRKGRIDREGRTYLELFEHDLNLPLSLRAKLHQPLMSPIYAGSMNETTKKLITILKSEKPTITIAVGDIIFQALEELHYHMDIAIIDFKTRRKEITGTIQNTKHTKYLNPPGTIKHKVVSHLYENINKLLEGKNSKTSIIVVDGEEDLLALPAILLAPLQSVVLYGQADQGVVLTPVTEDMKQKVASYIEQFV